MEVLVKVSPAELEANVVTYVDQLMVIGVPRGKGGKIIVHGGWQEIS